MTSGNPNPATDASPLGGAERAFWDARYDRAEYIFGEAPNAFLRTHAAALKPGRALCVADGEGRNGVWLARQGWQVTATEFSPVAIAKARALAARHGVAPDVIQADVHDWPAPESAFDLVVDIFTQFSTPVQRAAKWASMIRALRPGGHLVLQGYTPDQLRHRTGGPSEPDHLYTADMLRSAFVGLDILLLEEAEQVLDEGAAHSGISATIGLVARKS